MYICPAMTVCVICMCMSWEFHNGSCPKYVYKGLKYNDRVKVYTSTSIILIICAFVSSIWYSCRVWVSSYDFLVSVWVYMCVDVCICAHQYYMLQVALILTSWIHLGMISRSSCSTVRACFLLKYVGWSQSPRRSRSFQNCLYILYLLVAFLGDGMAIPMRKYNVVGRQHSHIYLWGNQVAVLLYMGHIDSVGRVGSDHSC